MDEQPEAFITKKIEQPVLGVQAREQLVEKQMPPPVFENSFYRSNKYYIWAIVFGLMIIGVLGYFAFRKQPVTAVKEANVNVEITAPEKIPSGGDAYFTIKISNNDSQKITQVRLELAYPQGVSYGGSTPVKADNISGTVFSLPDIISNQNTPIIIRTHISGNVGDSKQLIARLSYHFNNFNSEFVKEKAYDFTLAQSDISVAISGPDTVSNAQLLTYTITYKNNSDQTIKNARIRANLPAGFVLAQSDPAVSLGTNIWELNDLAPSAEGTISLQGTYKAASPGESKTWTAEFLTLGQSGDYNVQNTSAPMTTLISSLPLLVSQQVQQYSGGQSQTTVKPGDTLQFELTYQNNSNVAASGVNVVVTLNSKALDLGSIQAEGGQVNNNSILWSAAGVPNMEILNPSESGTLHFSVKLKDPATKDSSTNLTVVSDVKIKSNEYQTFLPGNSVSLKVSSPSALAAQISWMSGPQPPKVGQATVYKVRLALSNSTNDYSNSLLTAFVPLGTVSFDSQSITPAESSKVQFDASTGKLTWNAGILPANSGKFLSPRVLEFTLQLNPSASQAGQIAPLLKTINFSAQDTFTSEKIQLTAENLTSASIPNSYSGGTVSQ